MKNTMDEIYEKRKKKRKKCGEYNIKWQTFSKNSEHTFWIKGNQQERKGRGVERSGTKLSSA